MGIEPTQPAWKAGILPLNYTRTAEVILALTFAFVKTKMVKNEKFSNDFNSTCVFSSTDKHKLHQHHIQHRTDTDAQQCVFSPYMQSHDHRTCDQFG